MSALRRARIHLAVADALGDRAAGMDDAAEILAEHLWAAAPLGVGQRAAEALERAAEVAVRRYAFESAESLLARAVQLRRTSGGTASDAEAELVTASRLLSIQRSLLGYASIAQSPHLRRAKELARQIDSTEILARLLWAEWAAYDTMCDFDAIRRHRPPVARAGQRQRRRAGPGHGPGLARHQPVAPGRGGARPAPCSTRP